MEAAQKPAAALSVIGAPAALIGSQVGGFCRRVGDGASSAYLSTPLLELAARSADDPRWSGQGKIEESFPDSCFRA